MGYALLRTVIILSLFVLTSCSGNFSIFATQSSSSNSPTGVVDQSIVVNSDSGADAGQVVSLESANFKMTSISFGVNLRGNKITSTNYILGLGVEVSGQ